MYIITVIYFGKMYYDISLRYIYIKYENNYEIKIETKKIFKLEFKIK